MPIGTRNQCLRCGWEWNQVKADRPAVCPRCKAREWDEPRLRPRRDAVASYECSRCGHPWESWLTVPPQRCPKCNSKAWNEEREGVSV